MSVCVSGCSVGMGVVLIKYTGNVWLQNNINKNEAKCEIFRLKPSTLILF